MTGEEPLERARLPLCLRYYDAHSLLSWTLSNLTWIPRLKTTTRQLTKARKRKFGEKHRN